MAETLREVIERVKAQHSQQQTQQTQPKAKVVEVAPAPVLQAIQDEDEEEIEDFEEEQVVQQPPKREEKAVERKIAPPNTTNTQDQANINHQRAIIEQVEALQNNGVFRLELLANLDLIGKALGLIAEQLGSITNAK